MNNNSDPLPCSAVQNLLFYHINVIEEKEALYLTRLRNKIGTKKEAPL
jgi:hypothetical protein